MGAVSWAAACSSFGSSGEEAPVDASTPDANVEDQTTPQPDSTVDAAVDSGPPAPCEERCRSRHCEADGGCDPLVFTTPEMVAGDLGADGGTILSVDMADAICARAAGDGGVFKAWISTNITSAPTRAVSHPERALWSATGIRIAASLDALLDGGAEHPIDRTGDASLVGANENVWTGTFADGGRSLDDCDTWLKKDIVFGERGRTLPGRAWTEFFPASCDNLGHLYCFEVVP